MLKIRVSEDGIQYNVEFVFTGYDNYILKGIELMNTFKIITCSWDDKGRIIVWSSDFINNKATGIEKVCYIDDEWITPLLKKSKSEIIYKSLPLDDPIRRQPDITLAKSVLSWSPKVCVNDGLIKTINSFIDKFK